MVSGTVILNSSHRRKKASIVVLAVKTIAVKSRILIFCNLNSFADNGSTLKKGWKSTFTPNFAIMSEYGDEFCGAG